VLPDALGLNEGFRPRFLKRYAELHEAARAGVEHYVRDVRGGTYPDAEHSFSWTD
jgi:3-methyl-2-oxobutanoate hydroxymethyltransferase